MTDQPPNPKRQRHLYNSPLDLHVAFALKETTKRRTIDATVEDEQAIEVGILESELKFISSDAETFIPEKLNEVRARKRETNQISFSEDENARIEDEIIAFYPDNGGFDLSPTHDQWEE